MSDSNPNPARNQVIRKRRTLQEVRILTLAACALLAGAAWLGLAHPTQAQTLPTKGGSPAMAPQCSSTWQVVSSPNIGSSSNYLNAVDVSIAGGDVWAVGEYYNGSKYQTLIERRAGNQWNVVSSPNAGTNSNNYNYLEGVSALSTTSAWAVGYYFNGTANRTLIEYWNGSNWSGLLGPNVGTSSNYLTAVATVAANDVWATGYYYDVTHSHYNSLMEHWNGSAWSVVPVYSTNSASDNQLWAITIGSPTDIWAVGSYNNGTADQTLMFHYDGTDWNGVVTPNAGTSSSNNILSGVTAITDSNVWAVGRYLDPALSKYQTLMLHWNGDTWSIVSSPNGSTSHNFLYSIDKASANDVWAVGRYYDLSTSKYQTLVERWNGTAWSIVSSPNPFGSSSNYLSGVAVASPTDVWGVGYYTVGTTNLTLAERYNSCSSPPTSTPTSTPTNTFTPSPTNTPGGPTSTPTATPVECSFQFVDVPVGSTYYPFVHCLRCRNIMNGYSCGGPGEPCVPPNNDPYFRPGSSVTRGQIAKAVALAAGFNEPTGAQQYIDVPLGSTFYTYTWQLTNRGIVSGYTCGGPGEPCVAPDNLPYYRPGRTTNRGQLIKIVSGAAGFSDPPGNQLFQDVPPNHVFYDYIQRLAHRGIVSGYECGHNLFEPCVAPDNLPYFHPAVELTRGEEARIISSTFFPGCATP